MSDLLGAPDARSVHAGDNEGERIARHALPNSIVAGLEIGIEGDLERDLLAASRFVAYGDSIDVDPAIEALGLFIFINRELGITFNESEVRMPSLGVVLDGEGQERGTRRRAELEDWLVIVGVETPAASRCERGILDPESEPTIGPNRCDKVRVECGREPLDLLKSQCKGDIARTWKRACKISAA